LRENPEKNLTSGLEPSAKVIGTLYKSNESNFVGITVIFLMLSPMFSRAFKKFGVFTFGLFPVAFCIWSGISSFYLAANNYPFTNKNNTVLGGIKF